MGFQRKENISSVFKETFKQLVNSLTDESERCRELSAQILNQFSVELAAKEFEECLPYLIPIMKKRIGLETSEEVRLELNAIANSIIEQKVDINVHINDIFSSIQSCLQDPNPTMQIQSCSLVSKFAANYPEKFKFHANSLVDPLLPLVTHHQLKIRAAGIGCLGKVVLHGGDLEKVLPVISSRLLDQSPKVRMEVSNVAFTWILDHPDKDYWIPHLLPMALPFLEDESEEIRRQSEADWKSIGDRWMTEQRLEDESLSLESVDAIVAVDIRLPSLGCCHLVMKHQNMLYPIIYKDLNDWIFEKRLAAIKLLYTVLCHVKDKAEDHLQEIFSCLLTAAKDEESFCVEYSKRSSDVVGHYVSPGKWSQLVLDSLKEESSVSTLVVIGGFLDGAKLIEESILTDISEVLVKEEICHSRSESYQREFLRCIHSLMLHATLSNSHNILVALLTVAGLAATEDVRALAKNGINDLCKQLDVDKEMLFRKEISRLLCMFKTKSLSWTSNCTSIQVFHATVEESESAMSNQIEVIMDIFRNGLSLNIPEVRIKLFLSLEDILAKSETTVNSNKRFHPFILLVAADLIQPALVWHTGISERKIRSSAAACLFFLAQMSEQAPGLTSQLARQVWHQVLGLLEDEEEQVRLWICRTAAVLVKHLENDVVSKSTKYLVDRLGDSKKFVRVEAFKTLKTICDMDIDEAETSKLRKTLLEKKDEFGMDPI